MSSLPTELNEIIISFGCNRNLLLVSKSWNIEMKKYKNAIDIISRWYFSKKISYFQRYSQMKWDKDIFIRVIIIQQNPLTLLIDFPEIIVGRYGLNPKIISVLPPIEKRKNSDVILWLKNMPHVYTLAPANQRY